MHSFISNLLLFIELILIFYPNSLAFFFFGYLPSVIILVTSLLGYHYYFKRQFNIKKYLLIALIISFIVPMVFQLYFTIDDPTEMWDSISWAIILSRWLISISILTFLSIIAKVISDHFKIIKSHWVYIISTVLGSVLILGLWSLLQIKYGGGFLD